ncbi:MAG TPA: hypothetical protein VHA10_24195 [Hypericibacter adhaerens]|jgi:hypothetical protein|uniref:Transporter n=1 Tax=Hypericibacter adhaerens TaxID=2602016 RepID=A0A5J6N082_9PROT|nr:hypothetical protein [Hypericibacter adhaerens]QEX22000.1 hypothetical protein FRZ61_19290 [Hypericibacter adhaerens]HWA46341.1 hypothetical protein [Hypericibacter adhaerens]
MARRSSALPGTGRQGEADTHGRRRWSALTAATSIAIWLVFVAPALAQDASGTGSANAGASTGDIAAMLRRQQQMIDEQARKLEEQARLLQQQEQALRQQQTQIDDLQRQSAGGATFLLPATMAMPDLDTQNTPYLRTDEVIPVPPDTGETPPAGSPSGTPPAGTAPSGTPPSGGTAEEQRPESERPPEQLLVERGGVLLPAGTLQLEPSIEYDYYSNSNVAINGFTIFDAIVIGNVRVDEVNRNVVTAAATARYGVTDRVQVEARVPYVYRKDSTTFGVGTGTQQEFQTDGYDIGDVQLTASYQPIIGDGALIPDTILRVFTRLPTGRDAFGIGTEDIGNNRTVLKEPPTGTGFYGVGAGFTLVWRVDPVVFFGGFSYTGNLSDDKGASGNIDPGDTYEFYGGINVALSELVSMNLSFDDQLTSSTTQNGDKVVNTDFTDARLILGTSVGVAPGTTLTFNASAGLTDQSPDFAFTISLPITFSIF